MPESSDKNRLGRISVAARTALAHPRYVDLANFIGAGPSIRARARLALAATFLVAAPTLFIGVMRTEVVSKHAAILMEYEDYLKRILETKIAVRELDSATWAYTAEIDFENNQAVLSASDHLKLAVAQMLSEQPEDVDAGPSGFFEGLVGRLDGQIKRAVASRGSMAQARLSIISLSKELNILESRASAITKQEKKSALSSLSMVGRDQLILFLVLLFAFPVFVGFVPGWLVLPLNRLRQIASKLEMGQLLKDMPLHGRDEVALLARSLKTYFLRRDELDQKKSSKIFEMRNILRSVLSRVSEPVLIVDSNIKINYTNDAAANLVGLPSHQMEGEHLGGCINSPSLTKAAEMVFEADSTEESMPVEIEVASGKALYMNANIGVVRNRDGEVSRAVIVLYQA